MASISETETIVGHICERFNLLAKIQFVGQAYELFTHESRKSNFDFRYDHNLPLNQE